MKIPGLTEALEDLRAIADGMRILPQLARSLESIDKRTASLDAEVRRMREGVDEIHVQVTELGDRLEPHLEEMRRTLRPLERVVGRMRPGRRRQANGEDEPVAETDAA